MGNGSTIGSSAPGSGPTFAPDGGGVSHSLGSASQTPFGTSPDGGMSQMGPGVTGGHGAASGPSFPGHGINVAPSGSSAPLGASSAGGPSGAGMAPNASSVSPAATVPYAPPGAIRPSQTNRWRWFTRSKKDVEDEEAQWKEDERVQLPEQMIQVPIVGSVAMGPSYGADRGLGGPSFPDSAPFSLSATDPVMNASFPPSTPSATPMGSTSAGSIRASPHLPSAGPSSQSECYGSRLSAPTPQSALPISIDPPSGGSGDLAPVVQGVSFSRPAEYNNSRLGS
ncbi:hypothetical protein DL93DRAFT_1684435 [Clavulina sp. PMI_390]|nr:hypothetical protein DL93DRAFT_1684435 [Clavulina sp. PMI_390]